MDKLVSVVIPAYNYSQFVGRAIDSVLAQTYRPVECVVVDDGSTDDTPAVLAAYGDRIRSIRQENRGLPATRNAGIRAARGEYIALLDADDYWRPEKLARQVALAEATPDVGVVGCGYEVVDRDGNAIAKRYRLNRPDAPDADAAARLRAMATRDLWVGGSASGALIPKRVLDEVGPFDEGLRAAEDWDMWMRIVARHPLRNVPEVLTAICQHGTGSFRNAERMETNQWKVYRAAVARWPDALDRRTRRRMRARILADAGHEYDFGQQPAVALRRYLASLWACPGQKVRWMAIAHLLRKRVGI